MTFTFFISLCNGQMREQLNLNDLKRQKLNGNVSNLEYREFEVLQNSDASYSYSLNFEPFMNSHFDFGFNKGGYLNNKKEYYSQKKLLKKAEVWSYEYDKDYRILKEEKISFKYPDTTVWKYTYSSKDSIIIEKKDRKIGTIFYRYVQESNKEKLDTRRKETAYKLNSIFYYDKKNRIYKNEMYTNDTIYSYKTYEYLDSKSKNISSEEYFYKGQLISSQTNQYDKENNIIAILNKDKKVMQSFEYTYDKFKNWIEKKTFNGIGKFIKLTKRKINYFNK
jgi:hypothetical protein